PMLKRELYRGVIVWNKTKKRDAWGQKRQRPRPEHEWVKVPAPALGIVSDEQWVRAQQQRENMRSRYGRAANGRLVGARQNGGESKYLLPGLTRCGLWGGTRHVRGG